MQSGTRGTSTTSLTRTLRPRSGTPAHISSPISHFELPSSAASGLRLSSGHGFNKNFGAQRHLSAAFSPSLPPSTFSIFAFPAARGSFSAISNRERIGRLETMSNPLKTKAGHDF